MLCRRPVAREHRNVSPNVRPIVAQSFHSKHRAGASYGVIACLLHLLSRTARIIATQAASRGTFRHWYLQHSPLASPWTWKHASVLLAFLLCQRRVQQACRSLSLVAVVLRMPCSASSAQRRRGVTNHGRGWHAFYPRAAGVTAGSPGGTRTCVVTVGFLVPGFDVGLGPVRQAHPHYVHVAWQLQWWATQTRRISLRASVVAPAAAITKHRMLSTKIIFLITAAVRHTHIVLDRTCYCCYSCAESVQCRPGARDQSAHGRRCVLRCTATAISHARSDEMHTLRGHAPRTLLPACLRTSEVKHEIATPFTPCGQSRCVCSWLQCDSYACDVCYTVPVPPSMAMRHSWLQSNVTAAAFPVAWSQSLPDRPATPDGSLLPPGARIHLTGPTTPRTARSNSTRRAGWLLLKGPAAVPWAWAIDSSCGPRSSCCTRSVYSTDVVAPVSSTIVTSCPRRLARMNGVWSWATCRLSATRAGASARWWHQLGQRAAWMAAHAAYLSPEAGLQLR